MFDRAGHICPAHNENYFLLFWELQEFPANGKEFFSTKYVSLLKSPIYVKTFTWLYFHQTLSILQTFCEPIFGFQCVLDSTDGDRIADRVSLYRHNPLFVSAGPSGSTFANPLPPCHPVTPPPPCSLSTFPFLLRGFCCLSLTPTVLYGN